MIVRLGGVAWFGFEGMVVAGTVGAAAVAEAVAEDKFAGPWVCMLVEGYRIDTAAAGLMVVAEVFGMGLGIALGVAVEWRRCRSSILVLPWCEV